MLDNGLTLFRPKSADFGPIWPLSKSGKQNILYDLSFQYESPRYKTLGEIFKTICRRGRRRIRQRRRGRVHSRGGRTLSVNHTVGPPEEGPPELCSNIIHVAF